jgi:metal-responsive CopG/Arc/MetJ family transcriptional regulator
MAKTKMNFTVPEDVVKELKTHVAKNKRSAFVVEAVRVRLQDIKKAQLQKELVEGYKARCHEGAELNREWESATLEKWD